MLKFCLYLQISIMVAQVLVNIGEAALEGKVKINLTSIANFICFVAILLKLMKM